MSAAHDQSRNDTLVRIADAAERIAAALEDMNQLPAYKEFAAKCKIIFDKHTPKNMDSPWRD